MEKVKPIILNDNAVLGELDVILEQADEENNREQKDNQNE